MKKIINNETKSNQKRLKILLVTDRMSYGGAETHILSLYRALTSLGHYVTVVSAGGELSQNTRHVLIDLNSRSPIKLMRGYLALYSLVSAERYDLIHAHARLPALISSIVAHFLKIPFVTTVHARFKVDFLRRHLSAWGFRSVAVSEDLRGYLSKNYSIPAENITVIENGIDFERYSKATLRPRNNAEPFNLLFLSRLDEDCSLCADILCDIAPRLASKYGKIKITIGGGGECFKRIKKKAAEVNSRLKGEVICAVGEICDVCEFMSCGDALVGVSRCAIEGIASSIPVIIAGNEGFLGRLTPSNFSYALGSNFCARGEGEVNSELLFKSICNLIESYSTAKCDAERISDNARSLLDLSVISPKYEKFYLDSIKNYASFKEKKAETLLFGYYGFSNLGDDALLRVSIERARGEFGSSVGALVNAPKKTSRQFAIPCYSRIFPFSLIFRIWRCKRLIFGGGTVFQDGTSRRSLIYYLLVLRLALFLKKDVLLYANGIGEIRSERLKKILLDALAKCSYVGVRDERSFALLKKSLPYSSNIFLEADLSTYLPSSTASRAKYLIYNALKDLKNVQGKCNSFFVVCPHFRASRFDRFELDIAIRKQKNKGLTPIFIPCSPLDVYICRAFHSRFGGGIIGNCASLSFSDILSVFSFARCVISMRYHPLIAARLCSVDFVAIGSDSKIDEFK